MSNKLSPNKGGRPPKLTDEMFWEILQIKVEFEQTSWKQTLKLTQRIYPHWKLPTYNNFLLYLSRKLLILAQLIQYILLLNRHPFGQPILGKWTKSPKKNLKILFVDSTSLLV